MPTAFHTVEGHALSSADRGHVAELTNQIRKASDVPKAVRDVLSNVLAPSSTRFLMRAASLSSRLLEAIARSSSKPSTLTSKSVTKSPPSWLLPARRAGLTATSLLTNSDLILRPQSALVSPDPPSVTVQPHARVMPYSHGARAATSHHPVPLRGPR